MKKRRRLKKLALVIALAALATLPWWQRIAVFAGARVAGADYTRYESVADGRFRLHGVTWTAADGSVRVEADEVEAADFLRWAWTRRAGLEVRRWNVAIAGSGTSETAEPKDGTKPVTPAEAVRMASDVAGTLTRWVGPISIRDGRVALPPAHEILLPRIDFDAGALTAELGWRDEAVTARVEPQADAVAFAVASGKWMLGIQGKMTDAGKVDVALRDTSGKTKGECTLEADVSDSWGVSRATTRGGGWRVPAALWDVTGNYGDLAAEWTADWTGRAGSAHLKASAVPREGAQMPPVQMEVEAEGDLARVAIRRLEIEMPQVKAHLVEPFVMDWTGRLESERSVFEFDMDLAALRMAGVTGIAGSAKGRVSFTPGPMEKLAADFSLAVGGLAWESRAVGDVKMEGEARWPAITLRKALVALAGNGGEIELSGTYDTAKKAVSNGVLSATLRDESVVVPWIGEGLWPEGAGFGAVKANLTFSGVIPAALTRAALAGVRHEGEVEIRAARAPSSVPLKPVSVGLAWTGQGGAVEVSRLHLAVEENSEKSASWEFAGKLQSTAAAEANALDSVTLTIERGRWLRGGDVWAELAEPVTLRHGGDAGLAVSPLRFGEKRDGGFSVAAEAGVKADGGRVRVEIAHATSAMLADWLTADASKGMAWAESWELVSFLVDASWRGEEAVTGMARGEITLTPLPEQPLAASFEIVADEKAVELRRAGIKTRQAVLADLHGRVPATLHARAGEWLTWRATEPFLLELVSRDDMGWKEEMAMMSGVRLSGAELRAQLSGTLSEPRGTIRLQAAGLEIPEDNTKLRLPFSLPSVEDVNVEIALDGEGVRLDDASVKIDGRPVRLSGRLPVKPSEWRQLPQTWQRLARERVEGRFSISEAKVASIARYMPTYLTPAGVLSADIAYGPKQRIEGLLTLGGAASRPLAPFGVLQEVEARIRFHDRSVTLESIKALAGGRSVTMTGGAEWPRGGQPAFDVRLRGQGVPFVRQTGLVVRGDLDLTVRSLPDRPRLAKISGEVRLRDSMFLTDFTTLLSSDVRGASRRPPYFSVEDAPFNQWELDVALRGERFLRVRAPVFEGVASAHFNLTGTLGNPRAVGEARVDRGRILFPFAVFTVQEGASVRLTEASPYELGLMVSAVSQRFDYDLRLELTGTAEAPVLQFFSSPALDSEQILLLVMAGVAPSENSFSTSSYRLARFGSYLGADMLRQLGLSDDSAERLTIRSGDKLSRMGKETYLVEYDIGGNLSFVGEYDEFDSYNAGIKWRFTPGRKKRAEQEKDKEAGETPPPATPGPEKTEVKP